jgi:hypothetical protein
VAVRVPKVECMAAVCLGMYDFAYNRIDFPSEPWRRGVEEDRNTVVALPGSEAEVYRAHHCEGY